MDADDTQADEILSDGWIEAHNLRVEAFRAEHLPRIEALTDDECRRICDRWDEASWDMSAARLAREFRDELGMTWPDDCADAIGLMLVPAVLRRLDRYDDDFRPWPEPQDMGPIADGRLWYLPATHRFRVELTDLSAEFEATYRPRFGVDSTDMDQAYAAYEGLASANGGVDGKSG